MGSQSVFSQVLRSQRAKQMAREAAESKPVGVCEKLFNAFNFNPSFRPLRRLTVREHSDAGDHQLPQPPLAVPRQPQKAAAMPLPTAPSPKLVTTTVPGFENVQHKAVPMPTAPKPPPPAVLPMLAPPKAVAQPHPAAGETKKTINEKATEFIHKTKLKIRSGSFTRAPTTKKPSS